MTKVILVRHGETQWNVAMKCQGHRDIELTELGLKQAELAAGRLVNENVAAVYASDLSRAFITATCIAKKHELPVTAIPELREINFGEWEGLTFRGNEQWSADKNKLFTHPDEVIIPGGETFRAVKERATIAIDKLVATHPKQTIVIVSHGGTIRTLLCAVLNIHLNYLWNIKQDNTAINILEYYENRVIVSLVNDIHHLNNYKTEQ